MKNTKFKTVNDYFKSITPQMVARMKSIRKEIKKVAPLAEEVISYDMPALKYKGILVYYAVYKNHIGFYPTPSAIREFEEELKDYTWSKGSVQFQHDQPLPLELIRRMTAFRYQEKLNEN